LENNVISDKSIFIFVEIECGSESQALWINKEITNSTFITLNNDSKIWKIKKVYEGTEKTFVTIYNKFAYLESDSYRRHKYGYTKFRPFRKTIFDCNYILW